MAVLLISLHVDYMSFGIYSETRLLDHNMIALGFEEAPFSPLSAQLLKTAWAEGGQTWKVWGNDRNSGQVELCFVVLECCVHWVSTVIIEPYPRPLHNPSSSRILQRRSCWFGTCCVA